MNDIGLTIKGLYRDVLQGPDGLLHYDSGWRANTIVNRCRILIAGFMKKETSKTAEGIHHLTVGRGDDNWDTAGAPAPVPDSTGLVNPFSPTIPVQKLKLEYLDEKDNVVTNTFTSRLQITATLEAGFPAPLTGKTFYPLREFGLFGFFGEDYMINYVRHPVIQKDPSMTLVRVIRLYF